MITVSNFTKAVTSDMLKTAPDVLRNDFDFVKENIDLYNDDDDIKKYIDTYISKLNKVAGKAKKPEPAKAKPKSKPQVKVKTSTKKQKVAASKKVSKSTKQQPAKQLSFEQVAKVSPEVRFIKRYVLMDGKRKTRKQLLSFINTLQRSIEKKEIRKTSKYAKEIVHIQNELVKIYNDNEVGETFTFKLDSSDKSILDKFHKIAGSEKQRASVRLISRYIGIHGKTNVKEKAERLLKAIKSAFKKSQIGKTDPYYKEVKKVEKNLQEYVKAKETKLQINKVDLKGLQGIPGINRDNSPFGERGTGSECNGQPVILDEDFGLTNENSNQNGEFSGLGTVSAMQLADFNYETYGFDGKWLSMIGDPAKPFTLMFWSRPGKGKSTLSIELAKYLAEKFQQKVLYVAAEEGLSYTLQEKFERLNAFHPNIAITADLPAEITEYDVVFIDSVTRLKMTPEQFVALKNRYPEKTFVLVFQATSSGDYRGSKEWEHEVDASININENGYARAEKTRFGGTGTLKVFQGTPDHIYKFTQLQDAEKFVANRKDEKLRMIQGDDGKVWVTNNDKARELASQGYQLY